MSAPETAIVNAGPVIDWLGLGPIKPEGLHGRNRGTLVRRHTRETVRAGGRYFHQALAATYDENREKPLMMHVRPGVLDDGLWRFVYAVLAKGGPVLRGSLIHNLALLTGPDRRAADERAQLLWRRWDQIHRGYGDERAKGAEALDGDVDGPDDGAPRMGRTPKGEGEHHVPLKITLPPDIAAELRADPDGVSGAIARMVRERRTEE